jgi:hypothetical protein
MSRLSSLFCKRSRPVGGTARPPVRLALEQFDERLVPATVATGLDGTAYAIFGSDRELWGQHPNGSWTHYINNISQVSAAPDNGVDVLTTSNVVMHSSGNGAPFVPFIYGNGNIGTIDACYGTNVYLTWGSNKELWEYDPTSGWTDQHTSNVVDVGNFGYSVVYANGSLAIGNSSGYRVIVSSGVHHVASWYYYPPDNSGYQILFTWGSDNELWGIRGGSSLTHYWNDVSQISCMPTSNGPISFISTEGNLWHAGNYTQYLDSGAWTY